MVKNQEPLVVLKPRIIAGVFPKFTVTLLILVFFMTYMDISYGFHKISLPGFQEGYQLFMIFRVLLVAIVIIVSVLLSYLNLRTRQYKFFSDRLEVYEGFLNVKQSVVRYERVTDISFNRSVWERIWGTGSIMLNTAGSLYHELKISYIRNPESVYEIVQKYVKQYSGSKDGTGSSR